MELKELIVGCKKEEPRSQRALFDQFSGRMMTLCLRYCSFQKQDAEDVLQEGFIRIFDKIHLYKDFGSFEGWMKRIFINIALRKREKEQKRFLITLNPNNVPDIAQLPDFIHQLETEEILDLIALLPKGYRLVFNLFVIDGYSHNEISTLLGITASTSRSQLTKAKQMLRKEILQNMPSSENNKRV